MTRVTRGFVSGTVLFLAGLLLLTACPKKKEAPMDAGAAADATGSEGPELDPTAEITVRTRELLRTEISLTLPGGETAEKIAALDAAFAEIERLESLLSEWKAESQVAQVNARAGLEPVKAGQELFEVIYAAREISSKSQGAFDLTLGALQDAWDFQQQDPKIPTAEELAPRLKQVSYRKMLLDPEAHTIFLEEKGMKLALGGIVRGFAIDRASFILREKGFADHLVVAGSDLYAGGTQSGKPWRADIRNPRSGSVHGQVELKDEGLSTSSNDQRYFEKDGVRYHHLLDPRTGQPARGFASVTVRAPTATLADGWATALFVRGPRFALVEARAVEGIDVLFFSDTDYTTSGTQGLMGALIEPESETEDAPGETGAPGSGPATAAPPR